MMLRRRELLLTGGAGLVVTGCGSLGSGADDVDDSDVIGRGRASWYGGRFHGRRTANGETFDQEELTAAHRTLPFGTRVRVRNLANGREVVVRINDRGPSSKARIIDVSRAAAEELGMLQGGTAPVILLRP